MASSLFFLHICVKYLRTYLEVLYIRNSGIFIQENLEYIGEYGIDKWQS